MFINRREAGERLSFLLQAGHRRYDLALGVARGGVVVAAIVAEKLRIPLRVIVPRKIGVPGREEFAMGALAPDGTVYWNDQLLNVLGFSKEDLKTQVSNETQEMFRRSQLYNSDLPSLPVNNKNVLVVDDGVATGYTLKVTLKSLRKKGPAGLVVASPVASKDAIIELKDEADELVILEVPNSFYAVGQFYQNFDPVSDEEVIALLAKPK